MINEKVIKVGECVPSIRKMSKLYNMSATPVIEAYKNLEKLGVLESRPKSSFVVASDSIGRIPGAGTASEYLETQMPVTEEVVVSNPFDLNREEECLGYSFSRPTVMPELFPGDELIQYLARNLKTFPQLINVDPHGYDDPDLVEAISKWMLQYKCIINKKEILISDNNICTALILALQACCTREQTIFLASPCPRSHRYVAELRGHPTVYVRSTPEGGLDLDALERAFAANPNGGALMIGSNFAVPTGAQISESDKQTLVDLCVKYDIAIVEDDFVGDLNFGPERPCAIKSLAPDRTIYISSFTNSLAPGLQINWACPGKYSKAYRSFRDGIASSPPAVLQSGFGAYVQSKSAQKHMSSIRAKLKETVEQTRELIHECFPPNTYMTNPQGGYLLWVQLPGGKSARELKKEAVKRGISIVTGEEYSLEGTNANCFTINCSVIARDPAKLEGVRILGEIANKL